MILFDLSSIPRTIATIFQSSLINGCTQRPVFQSPSSTSSYPKSFQNPCLSSTYRPSHCQLCTTKSSKHFMPTQFRHSTNSKHRFSNDKQQCHHLNTSKWWQQRWFRWAVRGKWAQTSGIAWALGMFYFILFHIFSKLINSFYFIYVINWRRWFGWVATTITGPNNASGVAWVLFGL